MTGYNKVFLDIAPIIYFLNNDVNLQLEPNIKILK